MRILLHICCGPCAIIPIRYLLEQGHNVTGWFYNPNIHPLTEYISRRQGALEVAASHGIQLLFPESGSAAESKSEYDVAMWCRAALEPGTDRCAFCRESRFLAVAGQAKSLGFDAFTSSLLYSRRQNHEGMIKAGEKAENAHSVRFFYQDFRPYWQQGIDASKQLGIYRQQYCGCVFSEQERYAKNLENPILAKQPSDL